MKPITIKTPKGKRKIGPGHPTFIIAEMSGNHNGSYQRAKKLIDAAVRASVDAIKMQTYTADTITMDSRKKYFQVTVNKAWKGKTLYELYNQAYTPWHWQPRLKKYAESKGVMVFSTPFDHTAVDFLERMKVQLYKVASFEVIDIPLLKRIGKTKKPVIISRGMASMADIKQALKVLKTHGCPQVAVLHCVSSYPADPEQMNLTTIPDIAKRFKVVSGLSDHSLDSSGGITVPIASVALGASIVEKHFTLRRSDGGPDAAFSLEPKELKQLVSSIREVELALGKPNYKVGKKEAENVVFRKSIFVVKDVKKDEKFSKKNIRVIRPGYGLKPIEFDKLIGKSAKKDVKAGTPLSWSIVKK
jgi:pseudaminic acid synthase